MKPKSSTNQEEWRDDSPIGLLRFGEEFITVGKDAFKAHRKRCPRTLLEEHTGEVVSDAIYYNFLHGVELALKSYLRHIDAVNLQELRRPPYGHNLCSLLDKSISLNLRAVCPKLKDSHIDAIHRSNKRYMQKELEYVHIGLAEYPTINVVAKAAETLIAELKELRMESAKQR